jgi:phosphoribosylaminoimidazolecarboxamide formyltransferase/IMP cyclohydrolase
MQTALISVSDKTGVEALAKDLITLGFEILSTGGTAKMLSQNGVPVTEVSEYTGFPEMLGGRLKTLHPKIHGGILARRDLSEHMAAIMDAGIEPINLVVVNLYPFTQTIAKPECTLAEAIEQIDIGGPTMLRAAAKNYTGVTVVVDPADYPVVLEELKVSAGSTSTGTRLALARKVFAHTAAYDAAISRYLEGPPRHGMRGGGSLCNNPPSKPADWPRGHRTTSFTDIDGITCPNCRIIAEYISRHSG